MTPGWRTAWGAVAGTSHARAGTPCQDDGCCEVVVAADGSQVLVASVADGAGSAARSAEGAAISVAAFRRGFVATAAERPGLEWLDEACARAWMAALGAEIGVAAEAAGCAAEDFACTLLGSVIGPSAAAFVQIGDGAIVIADNRADDDLRWVFWPQHGEFANSTVFVTMPEAPMLMAFARREADDARSPVREVAMFTDGLERLILDFGGRTVHGPSLRPVLDWLAGTAPGGDGVQSPVIRAYLDSGAVNRRTDDDKTLVLATRVTLPP